MPPESKDLGGGRIGHRASSIHAVVHGDRELPARGWTGETFNVQLQNIMFWAGGNSEFRIASGRRENHGDSVAAC